jgi:hypothetical protein
MGYTQADGHDAFEGVIAGVTLNAIIRSLGHKPC